jgi:DNA-binding IclR family transcriptional regulator
MESSTLVKAFDLLEALADREHTATLAELATTLKIAKPTAHRILRSLMLLGYVSHQSGGTYGLTPKFRWLTMGRGDRHLAAIAYPLLLRLHNETDEEINLGVLRRDRIAYLTVLECSQPLRRVTDSRESDPIFCTALGRAIVSHLPTSRQKQLLDSVPLEARTSRSVTSPNELQRLLGIVRKNGHAIERDQTDLGVTCIAAPVLLRGDPIAAISLSVPSARIDAEAERRWIAKVRRTAEALAKAILEAERAIA